ncbi:hypothetical protein LV457_07485 [Mycobacterium sp. MYCO198283]|uniref:Rv0361 family membrane protein n=1 Tax=Mycobacterium sp. MYCO198283 TaxID=2883505 RepID=UPI001E4345A3|nr:hypothetical protein [Mycobacterium sp. MYCO198283]MCG5432133.1 hypothetical protein [Mycobacterium sp. MYCO198283]
MRYNPPPHWPPPPPGWVPPPGWQPDPAWGPPPPGWPLWVDDAGYPLAPPRPNRMPWILGGIAILAVVAVVMVVLITTVGARSSDAEQIRATVDNMEDAFNAGDATRFRQYLCGAEQSKFGAGDLPAGLGAAIDITVHSITVTGSSASVDVDLAVNFAGMADSNSDQWRFVREDGDWKWCGS